jgi:hypothetical protein
MSDDEWRVVNCMKKYGGSFVQNLAAAYRIADSLNRERIRSAFPELWATYTAMAKHDATSALESTLRN